MTTTFDAAQYKATTRALAGSGQGDNAGREAAWIEIEQQPGPFEGPTGFVRPCELAVAVGVNSRANQ